MRLSHTSLLTILAASSFSFVPVAHGFTDFSAANTAHTSPSYVYHVAVDDAVQSGAKNFVDKLAQDGIGFLTDESLGEEERKSQFRKFLIKNFDMKAIGRFALGRYWRASSDKEQKEYLDLFQDMIVDVYSKRFSEYDGQKLDVQSVRPEGKSDSIVTSVIIPNSGPKVRVDWRVRYKNNQYRVIDIIVEGVSMALTQRSDFASVIQRGGGEVEVLLAHLRVE